MIYWIWLSKIKGIGTQTSRLLLNEFNTPEHIYEASLNELVSIKGIGPWKAEQIVKSRTLDPAKRILENCQKHGIQILTMNDERYPLKAKILQDMPTHLYYKGILLPNSMGTALVGPRRCTSNGKNTAAEYATKLANNSIPVISGMAKGIDSYAHTACLKEGGYTVAVLGNGLDTCYPSEHALLMKRIEENGLLLSEYEPGIKPCKAHFPMRNHIIAAWSHEIIVVEAGKGSGALLTAEYGRKYNRKITFL